MKIFNNSTQESDFELFVVTYIILAISNYIANPEFRSYLMLTKTYTGKQVPKLILKQWIFYTNDIV